MIGLLRDCTKNWRAQTLLCLALVPTVLFGAQLWWTKLYEPRYLIGIYPLWILILAYPSRQQPADQPPLARAWPTRLLAPLTGARAAALRRSLAVGVIGVNAIMVLVPKTGLWSGNPVREQYREAVRYLTRHMHQDDAFMVHPGYLAIAWFYYAPRLTPDPLPHPLTFTDFQTQRTTAAAIDEHLRTLGRPRSLLLAGPFHARTIDPPPPGRPYGIVGTFYQAGNERWQPCPEAHFLGIDILCVAQAAASATNESDRPSGNTPVTFGDRIVLRGYKLKPFAGQFNAGGELPITLFWQYTQPVAGPYQVTIALRRVGATEPRAFAWGLLPIEQPDGADWSNQTMRIDRRTVALRDYANDDPLPAGRYEVIVGVQPASQSANEPWLAAQNINGVLTSQLVLTTIDVSGP